MDFLGILKLVLAVLGIIAVGALIVWGLATLVLKIIDSQGDNAQQKNDVTENTYTQTYEPAKLIENTTVYEQPTVANEQASEEIADVDLQKAKEEERALNEGSSLKDLEAEEDEFIKQKQKAIEERLNSVNKQDEIDVDDIFVDDENESSEEESDEDIEALINRILDGEDEEETAEEEQKEQAVENDTEVDSNEEETAEEEDDEETEEAEDEQEVEEVDETLEEDTEEETDADDEEDDDAEGRIKALEEELARQKEEYENKLKALAMQSEQTEEKAQVSGSVEEYEARLEVLKERLKANEKELKKVKKDFIPLYKIHKTLERDNIKLRRKEALVAKQKVVLYGVNNIGDIDEEKAKKLSEDLDLLEGLRLSVGHCEEVMKANEDRYPILESSYNNLLATNENIKADIKECQEKIDELKSAEEDE